MPAAVGTQQPSLEGTASIANAIEELQNLDAAFSSQSNGIAKPGGFHQAMLFIQRAQLPSQGANAVSMVEKIAHHLVDLALHHALAQHRSELVLAGPHRRR